MLGVRNWGVGQFFWVVFFVGIFFSVVLTFVDSINVVGFSVVVSVETELVVTDVVLVPESGCRNRVGRLLVSGEVVGVYRSTDERGMILGGVDFDEVVIVE